MRVESKDECFSNSLFKTGPLVYSNKLSVTLLNSLQETINVHYIDCSQAYIAINVHVVLKILKPLWAGHILLRVTLAASNLAYNLGNRGW